MKLLFSLFRLTALLFLLTPVTHALSEDPLEPTQRAAGPVTPETLKAKIEEIGATAELDEATKAQLTESYRKTLSYLEEARSKNAAAEAFGQARATAPEQAHAIREELEQVEKASSEVTLSITQETPLPEVEQLLLKEKADLAAVEAKLADLEKQLTAEAERPTAARQRLTAAKERQEELAAQLKVPTPPDLLPALAEARRWLLETQDLALSAEIQMLDQELLSQPMRIELLKAQRDRTARNIKRVDARVGLLEKVLNQRRSAEAEQAQAEAEAAKREAVGKHPLVQQVAEQNAALSEELRSSAADLERVTADENRANEQAKRIEEDLRSARQKLEIAGLSQALGQVLQVQRRTLSVARLFRKKARAREQLIAASGLRQIQHEEESKRLRDIDAHLEGLITELGPEEGDEIRDELRALLENRRDLLEQAIATDGAHLRALGELDFAHRRLAETMEAYDEFLAEHLLWIRSTPPASLTTVAMLPQQIARLLSPTGWLEVLQVLFHQATHSPILALTLALFAVLVWQTKRFQGALEASGKKVGQIITDRLAFSFQALGLTLLIAAPWPLLLVTLGWQLRLSLEAAEFSKAIAPALILVGRQLFFLQAFRVLCVPGGLAAAHFRWPQSSLELLRRELGRVMMTFLPAVFIAVATFGLDYRTTGGALGRLAFVTAVSVLALFNYRLLHPKRGVLQGVVQQHPSIFLARLRNLWFPLTVAAPLALAGLALAGYLYTADILVGRLIDTLWVILGLFVVHQLAVRWLLLTQRRLAYQAALERREAARAAAEAEESAPPPGGEGLAELVEEPEVDLAALSEESRKLLNSALAFAGIVALWFIWSQVLPAFGILDQVSLWSYTTTVAGETRLVPVTLANLGLALLIAVITIAAARNLPSLMEIILLRQIHMTSGSRYAATTLTRYLVAGIGAVLAANTLGFSWSKIQWLVAALGVGIGFGLQEIVANFISGLIILFERPIRIGDTVTVGDTDGVVTRIRIRATTIRNFDQKELLVPNKEFVTGRLLNWSLSDPVIRVLIPVGVAYGSDVQKALDLMLEAAEEHERVLSEPNPVVTFEAFGDNALALMLRAYVGAIEHRLPTITDLHKEINRKFNEAGVVIAFPQRDLHMDTSRPLDIRIRHNDGQRDADDNGQERG